MQGPDAHRQLCIADARRRFHSYDNVNIFVSRIKPYQTYGRTQTADEAVAIDARLQDLTRGMIALRIPGSVSGAMSILEYITRNS